MRPGGGGGFAERAAECAGGVIRKFSSLLRAAGAQGVNGEGCIHGWGGWYESFRMRQFFIFPRIWYPRGRGECAGG